MSTPSQASSWNLEKIKLWQIDGDEATPLDDSNRMESEEVLENILVRNPGLLIEGLTLVGRQTPTDGGPLDLLGVDGDGKLCVFELKRGTVAREAVAQVLDYSSYIDGLDESSLVTHVEDNSGQDSRISRISRISKSGTTKDTVH